MIAMPCKGSFSTEFSFSKGGPERTIVSRECGDVLAYGCTPNILPVPKSWREIITELTDIRAFDFELAVSGLLLPQSHLVRSLPLPFSILFIGFKIVSR
jgi:hypothetical protein